LSFTLSMFIQQQDSFRHSLVVIFLSLKNFVNKFFVHKIVKISYGIQDKKLKFFICFVKYYCPFAESALLKINIYICIYGKKTTRSIRKNGKEKFNLSRMADVMAHISQDCLPYNL
jgi:hypothetical protein